MRVVDELRDAEKGRVDDAIAIAEWLLIHMGFALSKIDGEERAEPAVSNGREEGGPGDAFRR